MTPQKSVEIDSPELLAQVEKVAEAEGISVNELTAQALRRELAGRFLEKTCREGQVHMSDEEVDDAVDTAVHSWRRELRGRQVRRVTADTNVIVDVTS
jgi:hypothetical protein